MPVYEPEKKGYGWVGYLAAGCGGCLVLSLIAVVGMGLFVRHTVSRAMSQMSQTMPKHNTRFHWSKWSQAAKVSLALPDGHGTLTYAGYPADGPFLFESAIKLVSSTGASQEWPSDSAEGATNMAVDLYWCPVTDGKGPFVRLRDSSSESVLDLKRHELGAVEHAGTSAFMVDYSYTDKGLSGYDFTTTGTPPKCYSNGRPCPDITNAMASPNRRYLGSIVRRGNKLVLVQKAGKAL